jgi:hypothetical protein
MVKGGRCHGCKRANCVGCWIKTAIKHPRSLTKFAVEHRLMTQDRKINLPKAKAYVERNLTGKSKTHRLRQINLAKNLRNIKR